ncbi:DUF397 domain-containing protein [Nocardiopsis sp. TSRI0078]|uniref:DUF397 domain-containing protein n=1 Tax=unclassified Nocardiopsis TaxID=2649073 RepID=UPI00093CE16D|nr:DUF397 domain-containing protein [Nocardiopsis sp. TSRI0078]OKI19102.1 DUF397 domain-containing protein [Nocardiopsis sp. TSRI0078]
MSTHEGLNFFKSSYSGNRAECVEVAHIPTGFWKSSHSGVNGDCVEVAELPCGAAVRDSKNPARGHLPFPSAEWDAFLTIARR